MKVQGCHTFSVSRNRLWQSLLDPEVISKTLPGCDLLTCSGENEYSGTFNIKVGPVQGQFQGKFALSQLKPPESYHLQLEGQGTTGFVEGKGHVQLEEQEGSTDLNYEFDVQVGGRIASVGQRLLDSSARVITRQSLEQLNQQLQRPEKGLDQQTENQSQIKFTVKVVTGVFVDIATRYRRLLNWGLMGLVVLIMVFFWATNG